MPDRRTFLAALAASAVSLPLAGRGAAQNVPGILRHGEFYVVDGWVLTRGDLQSLGLHAG